MFSNPSLITRIAIGKGVGFLFGRIGFVFLPFFSAGCQLVVAMGSLVLVRDRWCLHWRLYMAPHFKVADALWFRSTVIGAWMNFVLRFFAYNDMKAIMV